MLPQTTLEPYDDPAFLAIIDRIVGRLGERDQPQDVHVVAIDNWFGPKWLRYSGKGVVAFPYGYSAGIIVALDDHYQEKLTFPPFTRNRIVSEHYFARLGDGFYEEQCPRQLVHRWRWRWKEQKLHRRVADFSPSELFVWYSSRTTSNEAAGLYGLRLSCRFRERRLMIIAVDPKVDYAFQYLFGRDSTRSILVDVLNSVLQPPPGHEVIDVELLNPFNLQETQDDKLSILDIKARDQSGRQFNVEMQMLSYRHYDKRIVYYLSKFHQQQLHEGGDYGTLRPTISISFLNHILFPQVSDHHLRFRLLEQRHHFAMTDDIEFHILELPKFTKTLDQLTGSLDRWLYFLRFAEKIDSAALPAALQQPAIVRAVEELTMLTQTDIERERYESRRKAQLDYVSAMNAARQEGQTIGQASGEQIGKQIGEKIGKQIGEQVGAVHAYQRTLKRPLTPDEQLLAMSLEDLTAMAEDLEKLALNP